MAKPGCVAVACCYVRAHVRAFLYVALGLGALLIGFAAASPAKVSPVPVAAASSSALVQGVYGNCSLASNGDACIGRLRRIAAGGFKVVLNYAVFDASRAQLQRYMNAAAALGIKLIWPMKDSPWWGPGSLAGAYPKLAASCGCADNGAFARYVVGLVKSSPSTWAYYLADEQPSNNAPQITAFSRWLHALDPSHPRLAIAVGDDNVAQLLSPYASAADVLGADSYPVGTGQPVSRVGVIAGDVGAVAAATHRQTAMVLQAFDWADYPNAGPWPAPRWPTRWEMRTMRDLAIRNAHPSLILWYSYFDIRRAPNASQRWRDLVWAAFGH